ncbi:hypothetical protein EST38_g4375 [Candolleomyces aberdarensis]|uniref:Secreted protein n=1 Tax=Candolleomyces aberdarensis TaxID=2316362 RepID=A0A4Q2DN46_9AGAR|nr:hypothetical protein EST38_g4375 [Candolleomyces aberdarensis]
MLNFGFNALTFLVFFALLAPQCGGAPLPAAGNTLQHGHLNARQSATCPLPPPASCAFRYKNPLPDELDTQPAIGTPGSL